MQHQAVSKLSSVPAAADLQDDTVETDKKGRHCHALREHIDELIADGWLIASRHPFTLRRGRQACYVLHGMLISDSII